MGRPTKFYEKVGKDGQTILDVPDSIAGQDGVIRLLQITGFDGSMHYVQAKYPDDCCNESEPEERIQEGGMVQGATIVGVPGRNFVHNETAGSSRRPSWGQGPERCFVCGDWTESGLTPLVAARSRPGGARLVELLVEAAGRDLRVGAADGSCAVCVALLARCDRAGSVRQDASYHIRKTMLARLDGKEATRPNESTYGRAIAHTRSSSPDVSSASGQGLERRRPRRPGANGSETAGPKGLPCPVCRELFRSAATLRDHMNRHTGSRPHRCPHCPAAFATSSTLFMHRRYRHSGERPYGCDLCQRRFAARAVLVAHRRRHTGERPFACTLCGRAYASRNALVGHRRSHSAQFRCGACGRRLAGADQLSDHMNRHAGVRPHICAGCGRGFFGRAGLRRHEERGCGAARGARVTEVVVTVQRPPPAATAAGPRGAGFEEADAV